jgi:hypothetical protein
VIRTPAPDSGTEEQVKREVAVPGTGGSLSRINERPRLARIVADSVCERAAQPRQSRALLTVRIQKFGLVRQALQQIRLAGLERQLGRAKQARASARGIRAQGSRAPGGSNSQSNRTATGKADRKQLDRTRNSLIGPDRRRSHVP